MATLGRRPGAAPLTSADIPDNSVTLAKMAGGTDGQVITYDASGDPLTVGPGTDGQVITSTGAGSPPAFEALPASDNASALTSGTLAVTRMAAGTVIKSSFDSTATATAIASTTKGSGTSTTLTVTHTANSTSNKLWIHVNLHWYIYHSAGMGFGLEIHDGSSVVSTDTATDNGIYFDQTGSTSAPFIKGRYNYECQITAASTSALTYTVRVFKSAGTMQVQYGSQVSTISIQEIQV